MDQKIISRLVAEGYPNEAKLLGATEEEVRASFNNKKALHFVVWGDSLSLPRPYRYEEYSVENPYLVTRFNQTYPALLADRIENQLNKKVWLTNGCYRGMLWERYEIGVGRGIIELLTSYDADYFASLWGYAELWHLKEDRSGIDKSIEIASRYADTLNRIIERIPNLRAFIIALPLPGAGLSSQYPHMNRHINAFNTYIRSNINNELTFIDVPQNNDLLHTDQQHFSTAGHAAVADSIWLALIHSQYK